MNMTGRALRDIDPSVIAGRAAGLGCSRNRFPIRLSATSVAAPVLVVCDAGDMGRVGNSAETAVSLVALCAMFGVLVLVALTLGRYTPELVPEHYGTGREIDSWGSKNSILTQVLIVGSVIVILLAPPWPYERAAKASNRHLGARGHKARQASYWLTDADRAAYFRGAVTAAMRQIGALVIGLVAFALAQTMRDGRVLAPGASISAMPSWTFPVALTVFIAGTVAAVIRLLLRLRTPPAWWVALYRTSPESR